MEKFKERMHGESKDLPELSPEEMKNNIFERARKLARENGTLQNITNNKNWHPERKQALVDELKKCQEEIRSAEALMEEAA